MTSDPQPIVGTYGRKARTRRSVPTLYIDPLSNQEDRAAGPARMALPGR